MPDIPKLSVALTAVAAADDATTSEAIRDWQFKRETRQEEVKRLRRLWDEAKASGPAAPFDIEQTLDAAKARYKGSSAE